MRTCAHLQHCGCRPRFRHMDYWQGGQHLEVERKPARVERKGSRESCVDRMRRRAVATQALKHLGVAAEWARAGSGHVMSVCRCALDAGGVAFAHDVGKGDTTWRHRQDPGSIGYQRFDCVRRALG